MNGSTSPARQAGSSATVAAVVPVGAFFVTWVYFAVSGVAAPVLWLSALIQVAISGGFALGLGMVRERLERQASESAGEMAVWPR